MGFEAIVAPVPRRKGPKAWSPHGLVALLDSPTGPNFGAQTHILPPGKHPWVEVEPRVQDVSREKGDGKRPVSWHRWSRINAYGPEFVAVGRAGFRGYLVFGFPQRGFYVLGSAFYGKATYLLGEDWEVFSQLRKAQLLDTDLHRDRIIHRNG